MSGGDLRKLRRECGMTQGELAGTIGLSLGFIGEMERGEKAIEPRTETLIQLICSLARYRDQVAMLDQLDPATLRWKAMAFDAMLAQAGLGRGPLSDQD